MKKSIFALLAVIAVATSLSSCLKSDVETYDEWRQQNETYIASLNTSEYEKVIPDWAPQNSVYIKWHNDRSLTANNLVAMSNSTVDIKYELKDIDGKILDSSYNKADSVYRSTPNANVVGMWIAMTTMHVGDSATVVVPYPSGYGSSGNNAVKPYTNLIFNMKIKAIKAYEKPLE